MGQSRTVILVAACGATLALPALLCLGVALAPVRSAADLALVAAAAAAWMAALWLVAWWEFTGRFLRGVWAAALAACAVSRALALAAPVSGAPGPAGAVAAAALAASLLVVLPALRARRHPGEAIALAFPLAGGRFLVTDGGDGAASFLVNYHAGFGRHRGAGVAASMRYATDVVEVGPLGVEAPWLLPRSNEAYRIWGRAVLAPCAGAVVHAVDGIPDNAAFGRDRPYGLGNHVVLRTAADVHVVLGHLRSGSVRVRTGDRVEAGAPLGEAGNSGFTERPHLHFQAMRAPDGDYWHGEPVPMRFGGRFLVKNQVVEAD